MTRLALPLLAIAGCAKSGPIIGNNPDASASPDGSTPPMVDAPVTTGPKPTIFTIVL